MKFEEIKDLTVEELRKRLQASKEELFEKKMQSTLGQLANPLEVRLIRRNIARVKTALGQKLSK